MRAGIKRMVAGGVVVLVGVVAIPVAVLLPALREMDNGTQFTVPGKAQVSVKKVGRYYLWNDYRTVYQGRSYNRSFELPDGLLIQVHNTKGEAFALVGDGNITVRGGASVRRSIGYVEIARPEELTVDVVGGTEERVFSFSQSALPALFLAFFGVMGSCFTGITVGATLAVWGLFRFLQAKPQPPLL